jgi:hypothetical protein
VFKGTEPLQNFYRKSGRPVEADAAQTRTEEYHFVHFPGRHGTYRLAYAPLAGVVPIFYPMFKAQRLVGVLSGSEIFIFSELDENIPAASSGCFC